ncbi:Methyltransferase type 11 [Mycolicibacterium rhodesiae JS60]|nr:Methyltransferase type 11 [Mycolicibacterium rhodesiae JS60]
MNITAAIKRVLPAPAFNAVRSSPYKLRDLIQPPPAGEIIPPLSLQTDGPRGFDIFRANGKEAYQYYLSEVGLKPGCRILDIGCGVGRKTIPLLDFLGSEGLYVGMDIDAGAIKWCSRNITSKHPNFVFFALDVFNKFYNPAGRIEPANIVLPFPDNSFDYVALWSVFTHMYPGDVQHYLDEARRVLKPSGRIVASYYLINPHAKSEVAAGTALWDVRFYLDAQKCWTNNPNIPEDLIGLEEDWLRGAYERAGLRIAEPLQLGGWAGRNVPDQFRNLNSQDIVIADKI